MHPIDVNYLRVVCDPGKEVGHGEAAGHGYVVAHHDVLTALRQPLEHSLEGTVPVISGQIPTLAKARIGTCDNSF